MLKEIVPKTVGSERVFFTARFKLVDHCAATQEITILRKATRLSKRVAAGVVADTGKEFQEAVMPWRNGDETKST